jgi:hypothetical protein
MIAGTVGAMAEGDLDHYAAIASLTALTVAALCLFAWLLRLSALVKLISDSILVGFKAGAGRGVFGRYGCWPQISRAVGNEPLSDLATAAEHIAAKRRHGRGLRTTSERLC